MSTTYCPELVEIFINEIEINGYSSDFLSITPQIVSLQLHAGSDSLEYVMSNIGTVVDLDILSNIDRDGKPLKCLDVHGNFTLESYHYNFNLSLPIVEFIFYRESV